MDNQPSSSTPAVVDSVAAAKPPAAPKAPILVGSRGLELSSMEDIWRFSGYVSISGFAPKGLEKQESVFIAVQMGLELGLSPMAALQNIAVINGRPGIYGDAALACVRASGLLERYEEWYEVDGKPLVTGSNHPRNPTSQEVENASCTAYVLTKRKGSEEVRVEGFSTGDAKQANLWKKAGPWSQYPTRMLKFRARGFNLRDNFGDVLKGFRTQEELADEPAPQVGPEAARPIFGSSKTVAPVAATPAAPATETVTPPPVQSELTAVEEKTAKRPATEREIKLMRIKERLEDEKISISAFEKHLRGLEVLEQTKGLDDISLPRLNQFIEKVGNIANEIRKQGDPLL